MKGYLVMKCHRAMTVRDAFGALAEVPVADKPTKVAGVCPIYTTKKAATKAAGRGRGKPRFKVLPIVLGEL